MMLKLCLLAFLGSFMFGGMGFSSDDFVDFGDFDGYGDYCHNAWKKGYKKGYFDGRGSYNCKNQRKKGYNEGYANGLIYRCGYDGGYRVGHIQGFSNGLQ